MTNIDKCACTNSKQCRYCSRMYPCDCQGCEYKPLDRSYRLRIPQVVVDTAGYAASNPNGLHDAQGPGIWDGMSAVWRVVEETARERNWDVFEACRLDYVRHACLDLRGALMYLDHVMTRFDWGRIAKLDIETLIHKEAAYKGSWIRRGGAGAFFMLARKWDRLTVLVERVSEKQLFLALRMDERHEGGMDDVRDLRCYLHLVEAQMRVLDEQCPARPTTGR